MVWFKWEVVNTSLELLIDLGNMSFVVYDFSSMQWCNWFPVKFWQLITLFNFHIDGIKLTSLSGNTVMAKTCILTFSWACFPVLPNLLTWWCYWCLLFNLLSNDDPLVKVSFDRTLTKEVNKTDDKNNIYPYIGYKFYFAHSSSIIKLLVMLC